MRRDSVALNWCFLFNDNFVLLGKRSSQTIMPVQERTQACSVGKETWLDIFRNLWVKPHLESGVAAHFCYLECGITDFWSVVVLSGGIHVLSGRWGSTHTSA